MISYEKYSTLNETLIGSQANYEIKIKITIYFHKIMISYEKYSTLNLLTQK